MDGFEILSVIVLLGATIRRLVFVGEFHRSRHYTRYIGFSIVRVMCTSIYVININIYFQGVTFKNPNPDHKTLLQHENRYYSTARPVKFSHRLDFTKKRNSWRTTVRVVVPISYPSRGTLNTRGRTYHAACKSEYRLLYVLNRSNSHLT